MKTKEEIKIDFDDLIEEYDSLNTLEEKERFYSKRLLPFVVGLSSPEKIINDSDIKINSISRQQQSIQDEQNRLLNNINSPEKKEEVELKPITEQIVSCPICGEEGRVRNFNMCQECEEWFCDEHISEKDSDICKKCLEKEEPSLTISSKWEKWLFTKEELEAIKEQVEGSWGAGTYFRKFISINNSILSKIEKMLK